MTQEQTTIKIIQKSLPAIVSVSVYQNIDKLANEQPRALFPVLEKHNTRRNHFVKKMEGDRFRIDGGSGFLVDKSGIVVTNMHVVHKGHLEYQVTTYDNNKHKAKLIGADVINDVAFLKILSRDSVFPVLPLGNSATLKLGQNVIAIGNALGMFNNTVSSGIVSGLARSIEAENEEIKESLRGLIQTDAAINPGNSGGPLIDGKGKVVGINAATVSHAENISFAIPINAIKKDLKLIKKFGKIQKPFFGVRYVIVDEAVKQSLRLPVKHGALITSPTPAHSAVIPQSPAHKSGLRTGDIVLSIKNKKITPSYTLQDCLEECKVNQKVSVTFMRGKKIMKTEVFLEEYLHS